MPHRLAGVPGARVGGGGGGGIRGYEDISRCVYALACVCVPVCGVCILRKLYTIMRHTGGARCSFSFSPLHTETIIYRFFHCRSVVSGVCLLCGYRWFIL